MAADERDEQYLLRVQDESLSRRLTALLRAKADDKSDVQALHLTFEDNRRGHLTMGKEQYLVHVKDMPTLVESYKTYDDIHIVKSNDVGQMLVVTAPGTVVASDEEARDGVTPAMRRARARHFRPKVQVPAAVVAQVEADLLNILAGGAPDNVEYLDVEEEYVIGEDGSGSWQPARPVAKPAQQTRKKPGPRKQVGTGAAKKKATDSRPKPEGARATATIPVNAGPPAVPSVPPSNIATPEVEEI